MNLSETGIVGSLVVSISALGLSLFRGDQKRLREIDDLRGRVATLEGQVGKMETSFSAIQKAVGDLPVMSAKLDSLDRLLTYRMDELYDQIRLIARRSGTLETLPETGRHGYAPQYVPRPRD